MSEANSRGPSNAPSPAISPTGGSRASTRPGSPASRGPGSPASPRSPTSARSPTSPRSPVASGQVSTSPSQATTVRLVDSAGAATQATTAAPQKEPPKKVCPSCPDPDLSQSQLNKSLASRPDILNTEFIYYSATLRELAPRLTVDQDRQLIIPWLRKLFRPEYHSSRFREKRNKYLMYLAITIMNNEVFGIFRNPPPSGALQPIASIELEEMNPPMMWEIDTLWRDTLQALPEGSRNMRCTIHVDPMFCAKDNTENMQLDEEFAFLLYIIRPFVPLLRTGSDRTRISSWLQQLCTIQGQSCCSMKRLRNEYMMVLTGYVSELRVVGPFINDPIPNGLPPLADLAKITGARDPVNIDPAGAETSEFLAKQPIPNEGAFCYLAVTGDVLETSLNQLD